MTEDQKKAAGLVAFGLIALAALCVAWLAISAFTRQVTADTRAGTIFFLLVHNQRGAASVLGGLGLAITTGLAVGVSSLGRKYLRAGIGAILLGLCASVAIWVIICGTSLGRAVSQNLPDSMNIDHQQLEMEVTTFSAWGVGAWAAGLIALLGISNLRREK
jgi:hypothetical protein